MDYKITSFFLLYLLFCTLLNGQTLKRRGAFGAAMEQTEQGIKLIKVYPNTTASALKLMDNDVILSLNNFKTKDLSATIDYIGTWRAGDSLVIHSKRGKEDHINHGIVQGRPLETCQYGKTIYGEVPYSGGTLRSILVLPDQVDTPPVVYFIQGVGCASIDYALNPKSTVKLLMDGLVKEGFAVFRIEKPGMGDSQSAIHCLEMDYEHELQAFEAGWESLNGLTEVDLQQVYLLGESLGSTTASIIGSKNPVKGLIIWGGMYRSWFNYYFGHHDQQKKLLGWSDKEIKKNYEQLYPFYQDYLLKGLNPTQLKEKGYEKLVERYFREDSTWAGLHHYSYFQKLTKREPMDYFSKINSPVLSLAGEHDIHTANTDWAREITKAINLNVKDNGTLKIIPKTTHHYFTISSIKEYNRARRNGEINTEFMAQYFNQDIPKIIGEWIRDQENQ